MSRIRLASPLLSILSLIACGGATDEIPPKADPALAEKVAAVGEVGGCLTRGPQFVCRDRHDTDDGFCGSGFKVAQRQLPHECGLFSHPDGMLCREEVAPLPSGTCAGAKVALAMS